MSSADIATLITADFSALAALASWASVWQTRRERIAAQTPDLRIDVNSDQHQVMVDLHNDGGTAKRVRFCVVVGDRIAFGTVRPVSTLVRGEVRGISTAIINQKVVAAHAFVSGWNTSGTDLHVVSADDQTMRFRRRSIEKLKMTDAGMWTSGSCGRCTRRSVSRT